MRCSCSSSVIVDIVITVLSLQVLRGKEIWRCLTWTDPRYGGRLRWSIRASLRRSSWNIPELVRVYEKDIPETFCWIKNVIYCLNTISLWLLAIGVGVLQICFRIPEVFSRLGSADGWETGVERSCVELAALCSWSFSLVLFLFQRSWKSLSSSLGSYLCK